MWKAMIQECLDDNKIPYWISDRRPEKLGQFKHRSVVEAVNYIWEKDGEDKSIILCKSHNNDFIVSEDKTQFRNGKFYFVYYENGKTYLAEGLIEDENLSKLGFSTLNAAVAWAFTKQGIVIICSMSPFKLLESI